MLPKDSEKKKEQKTYFIADSGNVYMIVCSIEKGDMDALQIKIDEVINSLKIL